MFDCQQSKLSTSVRCAICGQGFLIYSEQGMRTSHHMTRRIIQHTLRAHHSDRAKAATAHPCATFTISTWSGAQPLLASAAMSNLLDSAV
jgi:hypothetical protein